MLGYMRLLQPPAGSLMVTDTCHSHPPCTAATTVRMSPTQVRTLPVNVLCTCLSALHHHAFCFIIPAQFCSPAASKQQLPLIPIHFDSFSTLSNDSDLPYSNTLHPLLALFPHLYKLVRCTVQVYILCKMFTLYTQS